MDWLDLLAVQGTLLQQQSSKASILQCSAFFIVQLSHSYMTTGKTIALTSWIFLGKVMSLLFNINMYGPITIFLIDLGVFSVGLFLLLCFLSSLGRSFSSSFSICGKAGLVMLNYLTFACLESFWFLHQIWRRMLLVRVFLVVVSSLSSL